VVNKALFILTPPLEFAGEAIDPKHSLEELFNEPLFRTMVRYNEHEGVKWYHKESLQESFYYVALGACLREGVEAQESAEKMVSLWMSKEFHAEYQVDPLLASLEGPKGLNN
jgi:hypothetical protein